jgi:hypothetical protein
MKKITQLFFCLPRRLWRLRARLVMVEKSCGLRNSGYKNQYLNATGNRVYTWN